MRKGNKMANEEHVNILRQGQHAWREWRQKHSDVTPDLSGADLREARLNSFDLSNSNLHNANLFWAYLHFADCKGADLSRANLQGTNLYKTILEGANLEGANLTYAVMSKTNLKRAKLINCKIHGIAAWELELEDAEQKGLIITPQGEPVITVTDIEVAQIIYLFLKNKKVSRAIDTFTSKVVLILGRFTPERKSVLDAIRDVLAREYDYVPVIFDFSKPASRNTIETVSFLAGMARFIIADITDPKSIPQELGRIVPTLPNVPVQPLLQEGFDPWGMFDAIKSFPWVLPIERYATLQQLLLGLLERVIAPAEKKLAEIRSQT
jgi:hypothetical protein